MKNLKIHLLLVLTFPLIWNSLGFARQRRKVIINQDCSGPGRQQYANLVDIDSVASRWKFSGITVVSAEPVAR